MLKVISKIPGYYLFRLFSYPRKLPMNLTLSLSYQCNSSCKTCNIYKKKSEELSLVEWKKIIKKFGKSVVWVTISGGEPFLRSDIEQIVCSLYQDCGPAIINIPTNGLLADKIPDLVKTIAEYCKKSQIVINVSIDDIGERHDVIRGVPGNYEKAKKTFFALKALKLPNLSVGIHTVISRFNVSRIPEIYEHLSALKPDSYVTEIAEERQELGTMNAGISPDYQEYAKAVDFLSDKLKTGDFSKAGKITRVFRIEYYRMVKQILREHRQVIPCFAGFASAQVAPEGDVWMCCITAKCIGNLREADYDFKKVWFSEEANKARKCIKNKECYCPLANASYTNILHHAKTLCRVGWNFLRLR
ncbi:MAG: radical SAM protein [PVC group bacterium]|nr:radical SAM protein [PVC group bacterium]